ncbi:MAG TPA: hypothetical protein VME66_08875 [Candidatus Acidoferrales bacterium]|nr:hypothetical protein [Candidatus Acidoferrales bacterium]
MESLIIIESSDELDATSGRHLLRAVDAASRCTSASVAISLRNMKRIRWDALCSFVQDVQKRREAGLDVRLIEALPRIERLFEAATLRAV